MGILASVFVIVGVIIGAGFASGKEIYTFFFVYGTKGIIGLAISISIIGYIIYKSLKIINKYDINTYDELLKVIIPKTKKIDIEFILNFIINTFLLITFFIMCAGFAALFKQEFGINEIISGSTIALFSYIILNKNMKGVFLLNSILIPPMIIILIILGIKSIEGIGDFQNTLNTGIWFPKAILYTSYNSITLTSILIPMKKYIRNKKDMVKIAALTTIIILILGLIIISLLLNIKTDISKIELPAVYASRYVWRNIQILIWNNNSWSNSDNSCIFRFWIFK